MRPTVVQIMEESARHFDVEVSALTSGSRQKTVVRARQCAMYLAYDLTGKSYSEIAQSFFVDHTTVLHAVRRVRNCEVPWGGEVDHVRRRLVPVSTG